MQPPAFPLPDVLRVVAAAKSTGEPFRGPRTWFERSLKDAKLEAFRWHDLRHTAASRLRQESAEPAEIVEFLGRESLMMTKRYAPKRLDPRVRFRKMPVLSAS